MPIIYREDQNRPLTNAELDENFRHLDGEVQLRFRISDFTAENISDELNTPASTNESLLISSTGTVGNIVASGPTGPWTATITNMSSTANLVVGNTIAATNGTGSLYSGSPTSVVVASIASSTSITYTVTGGLAPANGTITNLLKTGQRLQTESELSESNNLNAWKVHGLLPNSNLPIVSDKSSLVSRASDGSSYFSNLYIPSPGKLNGIATNADLAILANEAQTLSNSYTVPILLGGTGARNKLDARANLEVVALDGGIRMSGSLKPMISDLSNPSIRFGVGVEPQIVGDPLVNGDLWTTSVGIRYRLNNQRYTVASLESPSFTGIPLAPFVDNGVATPSQIVTLLHLANERNITNAALALKANINSPTFTGTPSSTTPETGAVVNTSDNSSRIATTRFSHAISQEKADAALADANLYTDNEIDTALESIHDLPANIGNHKLDLKANIASPTFTGTPLSTTPPVTDNGTRIATTAFTVSRINTALESIHDLPANIGNHKLDLKANIASPTFTGTPSAPTPEANDNTTKIATTAFTVGRVNSVVGGLFSNGSIGTDKLDLKANIASPTFTGTPLSTTPDSSDNSTRIATTAFTVGRVNSVVGGLFSNGSIGTDKLDLKANIASPTFTGTPSAPTPAANDNTTKIATTAFTINQITTSLSGYYTKTEIDALQPKWGSSRKFVQSSAPSNPEVGDFWFVI